MGAQSQREQSAEALTNPPVHLCSPNIANMDSETRLSMGLRTQNTAPVTGHCQRIAALHEALYVTKVGTNMCSPFGSTRVLQNQPVAVDVEKLDKIRKEELLAQMSSAYLSTAVRGVNDSVGKACQ